MHPFREQQEQQHQQQQPREGVFPAFGRWRDGDGDGDVSDFLIGSLPGAMNQELLRFGHHYDIIPLSIRSIQLLVDAFDPRNHGKI